MVKYLLGWFTPLRSILLTGILALVTALVSVGLLYRGELRAHAADKVALQGATEAISGLVEQRKRDAATLVAYAKANAATGRKFEHPRQGVQKALQADLPWAGGVVPPGVIAALQERSGGSNVAPN